MWIESLVSFHEALMELVGGAGWFAFGYLIGIGHAWFRSRNRDWQV